MKMLAIDGNSIINRAFYGIKLLSTKDGRFTNAVFGFTNILLHLIAEQAPDSVVIAWDLKKPTFRHELFGEYKAGRHATPAELLEQIPVMKEMLAHLGYRNVECEGYEADDILGTLARLCEESGNECVIATGDRDSLQLISDKTVVCLASTRAGKTENIIYNKAALLEKYGASPSGMIELKALMGDSSDNIPGVAGVGEKTATSLITSYGSIENIYKNLENLEIRDSLKQKLRDGHESALLSHKLGTICKTAPIEQSLSFYEPNPRNDAALLGLMTELELFKLMERLDLKPEARIDEAKKGKKITPVSIKDFLCGNTLDVVMSDSLVLCSGEQVTRATFEEAKALLENEAIKKRVYDYKAICKAHPEFCGVSFDSMLAGYILSPSASSYDIERLAAEYSAAIPEIETDDEALRLGALHSCVCDTLEELLADNSQAILLSQIELPLARVLADMETEGFLVDVAGIEEYGRLLGERISLLENQIYDLVGYEFNLNSPKQLGVALFEDLGLPAKKKTKSGYSTNAEVLESLRYAHPAVSLLLEYRQLAKLKSTYCDGLVKQVAADGRIHSTFNQTETRTGRISSLEPNLQNIPVRSEEGRVLRKFFTAKEGYALCDADYSQIELRVLAFMADDRNMIDAFQSGTDIHTVTASEVFDIPVDMVTPIMRTRAKAVNFGIVYGIGAFSLAKDIGVSRAEADSYIKNYLKTYPQVDEYMKRTIENAKRDGYVTTAFGRRRYLPELASSNGMLRAFGERVARNMPIQGTAADIIKIAMIKVYERLKREKLDAKLILQVHDELIVEAHESIADYVCKLLEEEMSSAADMSVRLLVDAAKGQNWFEAKR